MIKPEDLGSKVFKKRYKVKLSYIAGGMYKGIASVNLVKKMRKSGLLSFFGTGGLNRREIEEAIREIKDSESENAVFGINFLYNPVENVKYFATETEIVDLLLKYNVENVEVAGFPIITPQLVRYKLNGLSQDKNRKLIIKNHIIAKVSRLKIAELFLSPPDDSIVQLLLERNQITEEQAILAKRVSIADDICVESDSAGHSDRKVALVQLPAMIKLRDKMMEKHKYQEFICVGTGGGIGTPQAVAVGFILGADFVLTGSINQCTIEAGTSELVKDLLEKMAEEDTEYVPTGDMFEFGTKIQVLKKGVLFPARAKKLYSLYLQYNSWEEIDEETKNQLQEKYFCQTFTEIVNELKEILDLQDYRKTIQDKKATMVIVFKTYFRDSIKYAASGIKNQKLNFQIHTSPAMGAFNQWVSGSKLESWRTRHVDTIALLLMEGAAEFLNKFYNRQD